MNFVARTSRHGLFLPHGASAALLCLLAAGPLPAATAQTPKATAAASSLARAQKLVDAGQAQEALPLLDQALREAPSDARALLLRSTARFMAGDLEGGRADLDRSLQLDPGLRQAWLNRAALDIADQRYEPALEALTRAEQLDPSAADNDLNIGAVLLLQSKLEPASGRFGRYLDRQPSSAEASYLVATNYAMAGYAALAVEHLKRAVALDERSRLKARTDPNFLSLGKHRQFQELLATDGYRPPAGSALASRAYGTRYDPESRKLLSAVIDAMLALGESFDARVEMTPGWALLWGAMRIKVTNGEDGSGLVELSAPPGRFTPETWAERTEKLFQKIAIELYDR